VLESGENRIMGQIVAYGSYLPYWRLERSAIAAALGAGGGRGTRSVASYDEDATSMAVEAGRTALAAAPPGWAPDMVLLATTTPPYMDKTNATAAHAALGLKESVAAYDVGGATRSGSGALRLARTSDLATLVLMSDVRTGRPGGADESAHGDAAVAFALGAGPGLVEVLGEAASSGEFLDRWRQPGDGASRLWEERFGEVAYLPLAQAAITDALKQAGLAPDAIDHVIVTGLHARAVRSVRGWLGARKEAVVDDLTATVGNTGTAHPGLLLAATLDRAAAGETILVAHLADGADVTVYRATEALVASRSRRSATVSEQVAAGRSGLSYASFLTWRGLLEREPPRRPDPTPPAGPPSLRNEAWKYAFSGSRCEACGTRHLPPARVCMECHAADRMGPERLADVEGTIATYTIDRLAFSLAPPVVAAVIDFDGGGRFMSEMTDVDPADVAIGARVRMTFRRLHTSTNGIHDYFWKARLSGPVSDQTQATEQGD
jgi:hydroxymethylglutaryl-CoA synthase